MKLLFQIDYFYKVGSKILIGLFSFDENIDYFYGFIKVENILTMLKIQN